MRIAIFSDIHANLPAWTPYSSTFATSSSMAVLLGRSRWLCAVSKRGRRAHIRQTDLPHEFATDLERAGATVTQ
jgi:hypothetical protein